MDHLNGIGTSYLCDDVTALLFRRFAVVGVEGVRINIDQHFAKTSSSIQTPAKTSHLPFIFLPTSDLYNLFLEAPTSPQYSLTRQTLGRNDYLDQKLVASIRFLELLLDFGIVKGCLLC